MKLDAQSISLRWRPQRERILAQEEEHANDMHDLLVQHEGRPMLER
jgi:bacterioferritin